MNTHIVKIQTAGDERLLAEFKYAVDAWTTHMSRAAKKEAERYLKEKSKDPA